MDIEHSDRAWRAAVHRALGDEHRLAVVDALRLSDRTPKELCALLGVPWNLLAFHLRVLEEAGLVERRRSAGDGRRRYVRLRGIGPGAVDAGTLGPGAVDAGTLGPGAVDARTLRPRALDTAALAIRGFGVAPEVPAGAVLFVCTRNSARSQFAAALWQRATGRRGASAGSDPAAQVHPLAAKVAAAHGLDLASASPSGYEAVTEPPDLVVSVCDRALEGGLPFQAPRLHWSVDDPAAIGGRPAFEAAFAEIAARVDRLAAVAA